MNDRQMAYLIGVGVGVACGIVVERIMFAPAQRERDRLASRVWDLEAAARKSHPTDPPPIPVVIVPEEAPAR